MKGKAFGLVCSKLFHPQKNQAQTRLFLASLQSYGLIPNYPTLNQNSLETPKRQLSQQAPGYTRAKLQDTSPLAILTKAQNCQLSLKLPNHILRNAHTMPKQAAKASGKNLLERYLQLLEEHPYKTKMITSGVIAGMGDIASQALTAGSLEAFQIAFSLERLVKYAGVGVFVTAPLLHHWYNFLGRQFPSTDFPCVIQRLALDQFGATPFLIVGFFGLFLTLDGKPFELKDKLKQDFWPTIQSNWMLWIPANLINFRFVPINLQVLYSNSIGFFWNIYLSAATYRKVEHQVELEQKEEK